MEMLTNEQLVTKTSKGIELINRVISRLQSDVDTTTEHRPLTGSARRPMTFDQAAQLVFANDEIRRAYEACQEVRMRLSAPLSAAHRSRDIDG